MNAAQMIASMPGSKKYAVRRQAAAGFYSPTTGLWVEEASPASSLSVLMSIQPLNGQDILRLPEGDRGTERRKGFSPTALRISVTGANQAPADVVVIDGVDFQVESCEPWQGVFWKVRLVRAPEGAIS